MTKVETDSYSVRAPEFFDSRQVHRQRVILAAGSVPHVLQVPEMSIVLTSVSDFEEYQGENFEDKICASIVDLDFGDFEPQQRSEIFVGGASSVIQEAQAKWAWSGKEAQVQIFIGGLRVDEQYGFLLKAFCETERLEEFRPRILEVWQSLELLAGYQDVLERQSRETDVADEVPAKPVVPEFEIPEDGRSRFCVGGQDLLLSNISGASICEAGHNLSVGIFAEPTSLLKHREVFLNYPDSTINEKLGFRFQFAGIHDRGVPAGVFDFEFGKSQDRNTYMWDDGWQYSLEFSGRVELREGWVAMNGWLSKVYDDFEPHVIDIALKLDVERLDWSSYRFLSLLELEGVSPENVRFLKLTNLETIDLPGKVYDCKNLQCLTLERVAEDWTDESRSPLKVVSERLGDLASLETLHINRAEIAHFPAAIGRLERLQRLSINQCLLQDTPKSLWQLPNLKDLSLEGNFLTSVPSEIQFLNLTRLNVGNNRLSTLPEALGRQPNLKQLNLEGNPLESLPSSFNQIPSIGMSLENKLRLLDFEYRGADGSGMTAWNDDDFRVDRGASLYSDLVRRIDEAGNTDRAEALTSLAKRSVTYTQTTPEDYRHLGNTRFGGWPDLPKGVEYPCFVQEEDGGTRSYCYQFIAQIDCAEIAALQSYLPRTGRLYFFLHSIHEFRVQVLYSDVSASDLVSGNTLQFSDDDFYDFHDPPYQGFEATAASEAALPFFYAAQTNASLFQGAAKSLKGQKDILESLDEDLNTGDNVRSHQINGYVFTQHESPELQAALSRKGRPEDWVVLLKVASVGDFQWWDAGELFFVIHKSDLKKQDFSNVFCGLESS